MSATVIHSGDPQTDPESTRMLNPSARLLWRGRGQIQVELGARRVIVDGIDQPTVRRLTMPSAQEQPLAMPASALAALDAAGLLVRPRRRLPATQVPRLAADLAALRVRYGEQADDVLAGRRAATVAVMGTSRLAPVVAALLGAAGIGQVAVAGTGDVRMHQAAPGGVRPDDEGRRFAQAAADAVSRAAPECDVTPRPLHLGPDLVVLAADGPVDTELRDAVHGFGAAHLVAQAGADHGVVGPLALPGVASCLRCADLQRLDRDIAWSAIAVQLAIAPRHGQPSDVGLVSLIASVATLQALAFLDGTDPPTIEGTLEIQLPDWRIRRRTWPPHPDCDCGAHAAQRAAWAE
jgi:bacteriocin biosynthesis cyclodehydratase domain-containing protein